LAPISDEDARITLNLNEKENNIVLNEYDSNNDNQKIKMVMYYDNLN